MIIYPAIDIKDGKCVRLLQGRFDDITIYGNDPVKIALEWESSGARYLHVVDLDGARMGSNENHGLIKLIARSVTIPVQVGGGIRSMDTIADLLENGLQRVILGTSAVKDPRLAKEAINRYKDRIVIGIDAKDGFVAIDGWEKTSDFSASEFAIKMQSLGASAVIYTDIATDGMMQGPNITGIKDMLKVVEMDVIASGGVSSIADLKAIKETGAAGAITGKAIYTGAIDLREAILEVDN